MNFVIIKPEHIQGNSCRVTDIKIIKHVRSVLKLVSGQTIKIAVLNGNLGTAIIQHICPDELVLTNIVTNTPPPKKLPITLILAMPRPKALRRIIMDATSMGVSEIYIINSYRVEKSYWQSPHLQKIDEYVQLGLAQAGDTVAPNIHMYKRFKPFVEDSFEAICQQQPNTQILLAHPYSEQTFNDAVCNNQDTKHTVLVIGAEGGFIPYEVDILTKHGCIPVQINDRILRTETAISVLIGQLLAFH